MRKYSSLSPTRESVCRGAALFALWRTSNYGADMGKHAGATIEVATNSGTKDFHGNASEYNRNNAIASSRMVKIFDRTIRRQIT